MVEDQVLDRTYAALADPTRRALLIALRAGDARITDLAAPLPMTFAGVSRHVGVLESAGLIQRVVRGREQWLSIRPEGSPPPGLDTNRRSSGRAGPMRSPPGWRGRLVTQHERGWTAIAQQLAEELAP